ncbi:MAG: hypothetical protein ABJN04_11220 [Hyphomicrobiales bacterium]
MTENHKIGFTDHGGTSILQCPRCGSDYLHQGDATFYERDEDAPQTVEISVKNRAVDIAIVASEDSANPSGRRHGFTMRFHCEGCSSYNEETGEREYDIEFQIAQHKGSTLVNWSY